MAWFMSLCLITMDCTVRAKMSVPPPAPDATTNSTGRAGCQSAAMAATGMKHRGEDENCYDLSHENPPFCLVNCSVIDDVV